MVTATADDVRIEIETYLDDTEIGAVIDRVSRDIDREMDSPPADGTDKRRDLEAVLAALFIAETRDRAEESAQSGRTKATYEQSMIDKLRGRARRLDAPDSLLTINANKPSASVTVHDAKGIE